MGRRGRRQPPQGGDGGGSKKLIDVLTWQLDWADKIDGIVAAAKGAGVPLDQLPCVVSRVDLFPHLVFEAHAFRELSTDRPVGFDRGVIPWRSIDAFAVRYGLVGDDFDRLVGIIRAMDAAYLAHMRAKQQNANA